MTSRDLMPFGKYKGQPLSEVPKAYSDWLCVQEGFSTKNAVLYKYFTEGESASSTPAERETIDLESPLLNPMPLAFKSFWKRAYGERMRVHGQIQYIAFLRVACETWKEATSPLNAQLPSASVPDANAKPKMLPAPLAHIPAPPGYKDGRDEKVNF